jgi:DNA-binding response OmpR family regulator
MEILLLPSLKFPERALMNNLLKATVLVVDDEGSYREMIAAVLHEAGYQALTADSGRAALEIVSRRLVDAAILDLMMPGIVGRELLKWL